MDFDTLRDIDKMFARRWDVFVVACLSEQESLRFNQLAHVVSEHSRTRIADSTLNRVKDRLMRSGLVAQDTQDDGHPAYSLTEAGKAQARFIRALTEAVNDSDEVANGEDPDRDETNPKSPNDDSPPQAA
ncbi:winged helix-turn-helix transcriptional regulator [Actinoplanes sp. NPDC049316]|uniref:winged helix-turn-helix transcriptional regulator n=1 Tax=Actinoplanes sp. NPDC049316 TaxID=3154727 RepID=UPI003436E355